MRYLCCDPRYPEGTPPDHLLTKTIYSGVRFVVFPELWPQVGHFLELGLNVALVIAKESGDPAQYMDWASSNWMWGRVKWFIGNEPDGSGDSSWTMTPAEYQDLWIACKMLHGQRWIGGMVSGSVPAARPYLQTNAAGLGVHIYTLSPAAAQAKVKAYQALGYPVHIGETHPADNYKMSDYVWTVNVNDFCYSNAMVPGMGLWT